VLGPKLKDIANYAGVSITTVSKVINNYEDVNPKTRKKVLKIIKELNYQPHSGARSLVLNKTNTIGLINSDITKKRQRGNGYHFLFDVICGVSDQSTKKDYDVILYQTNPDNQCETTYLDLCKKRNFDGVIMIGVRTDDPYVSEVIDANVPTVLIDVPIVTETCGYVTTDNVQGAKLAIEHLVSLGHRDILFINGHKKAAVSLARYEGYKLGLEDNNIPFREEYIVFSDFEMDGAANDVEQLINKHPNVTAVFCASDLMAYGVILKLTDMGYKVPEDISVVGYDGIHLGEIIRPKITTISQDPYQMGASAVNTLLELFSGEKGYSRVMAPTLIVRDSTSKVKVKV
jgi:LacI family transcriptional regulator